MRCTALAKGQVSGVATPQTGTPGEEEGSPGHWSGRLLESKLEKPCLFRGYREPGRSWEDPLSCQSGEGDRTEA